MKNKTFAAVAVAFALVVAPAAAGVASATTAPTASILMFSKEGITDPDVGQEDLAMAAALASIGTVTTFDGGNGSAAAWTAALAGKDAVVFPEGDVYDNADAMSTEAAAYIKSWISAGHTAIGTGSYTHSNFINYLTGVDFTWDDGGAEGDWSLQTPTEGAPETLPNVDYGGGITTYGDWTTEQKAAVTPLYLDASGTNLGVGSFPVGSGAFIYYAYDWYPDSADRESGASALWEDALRLGASNTLSPIEQAPTVLGLDITLDLAVGDVVAGAPVDATGYGMKSDSPWDLVLRSTPVTLDFGRVDGTGSVTVSAVIPDGLEVGWHSLTLTGTAEDGTTYERVVRFEIAADGTLASDIEVLDLAKVAVVADPALAATGVEAAVPFGLAVLALLAGATLVVVRRKRANA